MHIHVCMPALLRTISSISQCLQFRRRTGRERRLVADKPCCHLLERRREQRQQQPAHYRASFSTSTSPMNDHWHYCPSPTPCFALCNSRNSQACGVISRDCDLRVSSHNRISVREIALRLRELNELAISTSDAVCELRDVQSEREHQINGREG